MRIDVFHIPRFFAIFVFAACVQTPPAFAQQTQGSLSTESNGTLSMSFEKQAGRVDGVTVLPGTEELLTLRLPPAAMTALRNSGVAQFPLCIVGASRNGISLQKPTGSQRKLLSSTGFPIEFEVRLVSTPTSNDQDGCEGGSLIEVQITTRRNARDIDTSLIGEIPILIVSE